MSPLVTYSHVADASGVQGALFSGKNFFITQRTPSRSHFATTVEANGGTIVKLEAQADYIIADHARSDAPSGSLSYRFIEQAVKYGEIPPTSEHQAAPPRGTPRAVASFAPGRTYRTAFTAEDDAALYAWVKDAEAKGSAVKGLELYRLLEAANPRHTSQSWRDRYIKQLMHRSPPELPTPSTRSRAPAPTVKAGTPRVLPPTSRAALVAATPAEEHVGPDRAPPTQHSAVVATTSGAQASVNSLRSKRPPQVTQPRPSALSRVSPIEAALADDAENQVDPEPGTSNTIQDPHGSSIMPGFEDEVIADWLEGATMVQETPVGQYHKAWMALAAVNTEHTAEEWRAYYERIILPIFVEKEDSNHLPRHAPPSTWYRNTMRFFGTQGQPVHLAEQAAGDAVPTIAPVHVLATSSASALAAAAAAATAAPDPIPAASVAASPVIARNDRTTDPDHAHRGEKLATHQTKHDGTAPFAPNVTRSAPVIESEEFEQSDAAALAPSTLSAAAKSLKRGAVTEHNEQEPPQKRSRVDVANNLHLGDRLQHPGNHPVRGAEGPITISSRKSSSGSDDEASESAEEVVPGDEEARGGDGAIGQGDQDDSRYDNVNLESAVQDQLSAEIERSQRLALTKENLALAQAEHNPRQDKRALDIVPDDEEKDQDVYANYLESLLQGPALDGKADMDKLDALREKRQTLDALGKNHSDDESDDGAVNATPALDDQSEQGHVLERVPNLVRTQDIDPDLYNSSPLRQESPEAPPPLDPDISSRRSSRRIETQDIDPALLADEDEDDDENEVNDDIQLDLAEPEGGWASQSSKSFKGKPVKVAISTVLSPPHHEKQGGVTAGYTQEYVGPRRDKGKGKAKASDTQDFFDTETQALGLADASSDQSVTSGPDVASQAMTRDQFEALVHNYEACGIPRESVIDAVRCTSFDPELCLIVLEAIRQGKNVPQDVPGIWTGKEDMWAEGTNAVKIRKLKEKHGSEEYHARVQFLRDERAAQT